MAWDSGAYADNLVQHAPNDGDYDDESDAEVDADDELGSSDGEEGGDNEDEEDMRDDIALIIANAIRPLPHQGSNWGLS